MPDQMSVEEFGATIKAQYPQYADYSDREVGARMLARYPEYKERVKSSDTGPQARDKGTLLRSTAVTTTDAVDRAANEIDQRNAAIGRREENFPADFASKLPAPLQQPVAVGLSLVKPAAEIYGVAQGGKAALDLARRAQTAVAPLAEDVIGYARTKIVGDPDMDALRMRLQAARSATRQSKMRGQIDAALRDPNAAPPGVDRYLPNQSGYEPPATGSAAAAPTAPQGAGMPAAPTPPAPAPTPSPSPAAASLSAEEAQAFRGLVAEGYDPAAVRQAILANRAPAPSATAPTPVAPSKAPTVAALKKTFSEEETTEFQRLVTKGKQTPRQAADLIVQQRALRQKSNLPTTDQVWDRVDVRNATKKWPE